MIVPFYFFLIISLVAPLVCGIVIMVGRGEGKAPPLDTERVRLQQQAMEELDEIDRLAGILPPKPKPYNRWGNSLSSELAFKMAQERILLGSEERRKSAKQIAMEASRKKLEGATTFQTTFPPKQVRHAEMTPQGKRHFEELKRYNLEEAMKSPNYDQPIGKWPGTGASAPSYSAQDILDLTGEEYVKARFALMESAKVGSVATRAFYPRTVGPSV